MAVTALIKFSQGILTPPGGQALIGALTAPVHSSNTDDSNVEFWSWSFIDVPPGSTIPLGLASTAPAFNFNPDMRGGYHVQLIVTNLAGDSSVHRLVFQIRELSGRIIAPFNATDRALNFGGQTRGWAPFMEDYLHYLDSLTPGGGGAAFTNINVNGNYTVPPGPDNIYIEVDSSIAPVTITLPNTANSGRMVIVKSVNTTLVNPITVASDNIEGLLTFVIPAPLASRTFVDGTGWGLGTRYDQLGPGNLCVANLASLALLPILPGMNEDTHVGVVTLRDSFRLDYSGTITPDGITAILASDGLGVWVRLCIAHPSWAKQASWQRKTGAAAPAGNDEKSGAPGFPIKTFAEYARRLGSRTVEQDTTIANLDVSIDALPDAVNVGSYFLLTITSPVTVVRSGTLTDVVQLFRGTVGVAYAIQYSMGYAFAVVDSASGTRKRVKLMDGPRVGYSAWMRSNPGGGRVNLGQFISPDGSTAAPPSDITDGTAYRIESLLAFPATNVFGTVSFVDTQVDYLEAFGTDAYCALYGCANPSGLRAYGGSTLQTLNCAFNGANVSGGASFSAFGGITDGSYVSDRTSSTELGGDFLAGPTYLDGSCHIGAFGIFDCPTGAGSLDIQYGCQVLVDGAGSGVYGSNNVGPGIAMPTDCLLLAGNDANMTITGGNGAVAGNGHDINLGGLETAHAWQENSHSFGPSIALSWVAMATTVDLGGFGGAAYSLRCNARLFTRTNPDSGTGTPPGLIFRASDNTRIGGATAVFSTVKTLGVATFSDLGGGVLGLTVPTVAGVDGKTVRNGAGAPGGGLGVDGDFYINTTNDTIYGPKAAGAWGSPTSLVGTPGTDGKTVRNGAGAPSGGLGVDGDFYINTTAETIYGPKTGGAWGSPTSLIGPPGPASIGGDVNGPPTSNHVDAISGNGSPAVPITPNILQWISTTTAPTISQVAVSGANGADLLISAQASVTDIAGNLILKGASGNAGDDGGVLIKDAAGIIRFGMQPSGAGFVLGSPLVGETTANSPHALSGVSLITVGSPSSVTVANTVYKNRYWVLTGNPGGTKTFTLPNDAGYSKVIDNRVGSDTTMRFVLAGGSNVITVTRLKIATLYSDGFELNIEVPEH